METSCQSRCQGEETKARGFVRKAADIKQGMLHFARLNRQAATAVALLKPAGSPFPSVKHNKIKAKKAAQKQ